jgi:pimeloyl-ACP methyl ester carboxylesterase
MPDLCLNDITLHYEIDGAGPPLLLLAGMMSDNASWFPVVDPLADTVTLIRPDNRTTGRTVPWDAPASIPQMARDALALMDHLGHDRFHVAGHSMGGRMAIELAGLAGDRVASLSILASAPERLSRSLAVFDSLLEIRAQPDGDRLWLKALYPWVFAPAFFDDPAKSQTALDAALAYPHAQSREAMAHQVEALRSYVPETPLSSLVCATQVIYAEDDVLIPAADAHAAFASIPNASHHTVPNAGHSIVWDAPAAVTRLLRAHIVAHPI